MTEAKDVSQPNDRDVGINDVVLLPCPFCGDTPRITKWKGMFDVECRSGRCQARSGTEARHSTPEKAAEIWNDRYVNPESIYTSLFERHGLWADGSVSASKDEIIDALTDHFGQ